MGLQRKLSRPTDQRMAILRNQVTALFISGRIETTEARAREVSDIAEKLITKAKKVTGNYTSRQIKVSSAKLDGGGKKMTKGATSKNDKRYDVVVREVKTDMSTVDDPARLHIRRQAIKWLYKAKNEKGENLNLANKLLDEIAPKYKDRNGGYTRIYKLGPRRGDSAEMVLLELL
ncbi:MAG: L17 family ribosomal protein [Eubacteriales bacterium]|nr:L17 family ribosomal protein [Eubacteriales bacterium]